MPKAGFKKRPATSWPTAPFILTKILLALCSLVALGTMGFFSFHLRRDGYSIPWQFITLAGVSAGTFLSVFVIGIAFCCKALNPVFSMIVDALLWILWGISWAGLAKGMAPNLFKQCTTQYWGNQQGVLVCHLYKNLFAWVIIGWATILASFFVGAYARSKSGPKYTPANPKSLQQPTSYKTSDTPSTDAPYGAGGTYKAHDGNPSYYGS